MMSETISNRFQHSTNGNLQPYMFKPPYVFSLVSISQWGCDLSQATIPVRFRSPAGARDGDEVHGARVTERPGPGGRAARHAPRG